MEREGIINNRGYKSLGFNHQNSAFYSVLAGLVGGTIWYFLSSSTSHHCEFMIIIIGLMVSIITKFGCKTGGTGRCYMSVLISFCMILLGNILSTISLVQVSGSVNQLTTDNFLYYFREYFSSLHFLCYLIALYLSYKLAKIQWRISF